MRLSTVILPVRRWAEGGRERWREPFRDGPWSGALPALTAAATATERVRLGILVTPDKPFPPVTA